MRTCPHCRGMGEVQEPADSAEIAAKVAVYQAQLKAIGAKEKSTGMVRTTILAYLLGVEPHTIENWRTRKEGPTPIYLGRFPHYDLEEVARWELEER